MELNFIYFFFFLILPKEHTNIDDKDFKAVNINLNENDLNSFNSTSNQSVILPTLTVGVFNFGKNAPPSYEKEQRTTSK